MYRGGYYKGLLLAPVHSAIKLIVFVLVLAEVCKGSQSLTPAVLYLCVAFYNAITRCMSLFIPVQVAFLSEAITTTKRIQVVLSINECLLQVVVTGSIARLIIHNNQ